MRLEVRGTVGYFRSAEAAFNASGRAQLAYFLAAVHPRIVEEFATTWAALPYGQDPYRRTIWDLFDDWAPLSARAELVADGYISLQDVSVDWDYPVGFPQRNDEHS